MPKNKVRKTKSKPTAARQPAVRHQGDPAEDEKKEAIRKYIASKPPQEMADLIAFNYAELGDFETFVLSMLKERADRDTVIGINVPFQKWGLPAKIPGFIVDGIPFSGLSLIGALSFHSHFWLLDAVLKCSGVRYDDVLGATGPGGAVLECSVFEHILWVASLSIVGAQGDAEAEADAAKAMAELEEVMQENREEIIDVPTDNPLFRSSAGDLLAAAKASGNDMAYAALNSLRASGVADELDAHISEPTAEKKDRWM
jgi:hypothetical protein